MRRFSVTHRPNGLNQYAGVTAGYAPANSAALSYDPTGALQTETTAGATTTLLYDGADLVGEYGSSGAFLDRYVPGPGTDEPVVWYQGAGTTTRNWLTADDQGSVIGYADQNGNSEATYLYGPYGEPITAAGAPAWGGPRYRYTGQIEIPAAQLYHYKARAYDPGLGRFYQTDPAGLTGGINLYAYATDDPINNIDPTGMVVCYAVEGASENGATLSNIPLTCSLPPPGAVGVLGPAGGGGASEGGVLGKNGFGGAQQGNKDTSAQRQKSPNGCPFDMHPAVSAIVVGSGAAVAVEPPIATAHVLSLISEISAGAEAGAEVGAGATVETGPGVGVGLVVGAGAGAIAGAIFGGLWYYAATHTPGCPS